MKYYNQHLPRLVCVEFVEVVHFDRPTVLGREHNTKVRAEILSAYQDLHFLVSLIRGTLVIKGG